MTKPSTSVVKEADASVDPVGYDALDRYEKTDVARGLGYDTVPERELAEAARPHLHASPVSMPSSMKRFPGRAAVAIVAPALPATLLAVCTFAYVSFASNGGGFPASSAIDFTWSFVAAGVLLVLTYLAMSGMAFHHLFYESDRAVLSTYASTTPRRLGRIMCDRPIEEIADATSRMKAIGEDRRPEVADLRRYALTRMMEIDRVYREALKTIGTSSPVRFREQATRAALKVLADVGEQVAVIDRQIAQRDAIAAHGIGVGQLEEGQHVAAPCVQEHVHVWIGRAGGGHLVLGDGELELHAQHIAVELDRLLGVLAAVGDVVDAVQDGRTVG